MKKIVFLVVSILLVSAYGGFAQDLPGAPPGAGTPAGAGDKSLQNADIKLRSVELERMKRDLEKGNTTTVNAKVDTKFPEIKEDFESMQISQAAIIKTYTKDKKIDYALIETSCETIIKNTKRLDLNLFVDNSKKKDKEADKSSTEIEKKPKSIQDLIVDLDTALGNFISSKLFSNLKVYDAEIVTKTRNDLLLIHQLSEKLAAEAKKLK